VVETVVLFAHVDLSLFELCEDSASVQVSGLNQNSSFNTLQQTIVLASLTAGLPAITNTLVVNVTAADPGDATVLVGVVTSEPVTLQVLSTQV
jgi:hypothetical protein